MRTCPHCGVSALDPCMTESLRPAVRPHAGKPRVRFARRVDYATWAEHAELVLGWLRLVDPDRQAIGAQISE